MALRSEVLTDPAMVDRATRAAWDALAVAEGRPCALSAWQLAAARHLTTDRRLVLLLRDGERLVGAAAFERRRTDAPRWLERVVQTGWDFGHRVAPLAAPGYEDALAEALATALPALVPSGSPSSVAIGWDDLDTPWPERLAGAWRGSVGRRLEATQVCPVVTLASDHAAWSAGKSRNFRQGIRRKAKAIERRGGTVRRSDDPERVARDVRDLIALHRARFASLGKRSSLTDAHAGALTAAAPALLAGGHLRLWAVEHEGRLVAAQLHLVAGDRMHYFNGGMEPGWEHESPGIVLLHEAVRDAHELGARLLDLGPGRFPYKLRFADTEARVGSHELLARDRRYPLMRLRLLPRHAMTAARRRAAELPDHQQARLRRLLRR